MVRRLPSARWRYVSKTLQLSGGTERSRIQLCGRLSVELDGAEVVRAARRRERRRSRTCPQAPPRSQAAALRTLLSRLRSAAGAGVLVGRDELAIALPEPAWVDLEAASAELLLAGEELAGGDPRRAWAHAQIPLN